jgi:hypothetical protein
MTTVRGPEPLTSGFCTCWQPRKLNTSMKKIVVMDSIIFIAPRKLIPGILEQWNGGMMGLEYIPLSP